MVTVHTLGRNKHISVFRNVAFNNKNIISKCDNCINKNGHCVAVRRTTASCFYEKSVFSFVRTEPHNDPARSWPSIKHPYLKWHQNARPQLAGCNYTKHRKFAKTVSLRRKTGGTRRRLIQFISTTNWMGKFA